MGPGTFAYTCRPAQQRPFSEGSKIELLQTEKVRSADAKGLYSSSLPFSTVLRAPLVKYPMTLNNNFNVHPSQLDHSFLKPKRILKKTALKDPSFNGTASTRYFNQSASKPQCCVMCVNMENV